MIKTRFIVAIGLLMTLACCSNSGNRPDPRPQPAHAADATRDGGLRIGTKRENICARRRGALVMGCQLPALPELGIQRPPQEARDTPNGRGAQARGRKQPRRGGQTQSFGHPLPPDTRRFHRCGGKPGRNALPGRAGLHGRRSCRTGHLHYAGPYQPHGQRLRAQFGIHDRRPPGVGTRQGGRPEIEKLRPPAAHAQKQLFGDDLCG